MIVLSLIERDPEAVKRLLVEPPEGCDAVEVRLDALRPADAKAPARWYPAGAAAKPVIAAFRSAGEGGLSRAADSSRAEALLAAARAGVTYVDVDRRSGLARSLGDLAPSKVILSHHDARRTPPAADLRKLHAKMAAVRGTSIVKIVTTARRVEEIVEIRTLLARARSPLAAFAMGEHGVASRILALRWGSWATYVCLRRGAETAPGQITLEEALEVFRIPEIDDHTALTGIAGYPVAHSLSPRMHNAAYRHASLNFRYLPFPMKSADEIPRVMRLLKIRGLSVTAPHKVSLARSLRNLEPAAREFGAVNTVLHAGRALYGLNTDAEGTLAALRAHIDPAGRTAVVVGAGGSARAVAAALTRAGAKVIVCSRRERPGRAVAALASGRFVPPSRLARESYEILINATPAGMDGRSLPVPKAAIRGLVIGDLIYTPVLTPLLAAAAERGIAAFGGLDVLLQQGLAQYALFTGREPPIEAMREAISKAPAGGG